MRIKVGQNGAVVFDGAGWIGGVNHCHLYQTRNVFVCVLRLLASADGERDRRMFYVCIIILTKAR